MRKSVKPVGTGPGITHGNCNVHKQQVDGSPPFGPILWALQVSTYNLAKFLVPILNPLTKNEYTVKDSFQFSGQICEQDPELSLGSLDVTHFLLTFLLMKLLIYASMSSLKTLILLKVLQSQNLKNYYVWLQRSLILYLTVYFRNKLMVWQWGHLLDLPLLTNFCHPLKKKIVQQLSARI